MRQYRHEGRKRKFLTVRYGASKVYTSIEYNVSIHGSASAKAALTSVQGIGQVVHQSIQAGNHFNHADNLPENTIAPLKELPHLLLDFFGGHVVGIEVIRLRLLLQDVGLRHLLVSATAASTDGQFGEDVFDD